MVAEQVGAEVLIDRLRASMRTVAASVALVTATDLAGIFHGMAATSWSSLSLDPPSMMVAVNRSASVHAVISLGRAFCLNLMRAEHADIIETFSRSDMRHLRFSQEDWEQGPLGVPVFRSALASQVCTVAETVDYGTHTIFVGNVIDVFIPELPKASRTPLVWMNGSRATLDAPVANAAQNWRLTNPNGGGKS